MVKRIRKRLGDILVEIELISQEQLEKALKEKKPNEKLGEALIKQGFITEQQLIKTLEYQLGIKHVSLYSYPIDKSILSLVPKETAKRNLLFPLKREEDKLYIAMVDPMDFIAIDDLRMSTGFQIERLISTKDDILKAIAKYYGFDDGSVDEVMSELPKGQVADETEVTNEDAPIVRLVNQIISNAVQQKVSDIHFDPQETAVAIRYRGDGVLRTEQTLPKHMQNVLTARVKIMANLNITENRVPQDGRIKVTLEHQTVDIRVSTLPTVFGEKIVMRILDLSNASLGLASIGFQDENYNNFIKMIEQPTGIVLVSGPTGSGKSSTLYAALNHLNSEEVNIITIEDPVEYQLEGINQIQVNSNVGLTFAQGLRAVLRQDPNIIMVGEIRDTETAQIAVRASLTGHLVLSTIHTNDALSTITRLVDMGVEPFLVAASISGVVAQRLVRRVCRDCKREEPLSEREREIFAKRGIAIDHVVRGKGCGTCNMTGYKGRVAIHELLVVDDNIRRMIMDNKSVSAIKDYAASKEFFTLLDDGLFKVKEGLTTTEEILRVAISE